MIKPVGYRIIVKPDDVETETEAGIIIAVDEKVEKTGIQMGTVVAVGERAYHAHRLIDDNGVEREGRPWVKPGDYVLWSRHAGRFYYDPFESDENGENEYMILNDDDVIGIMTPGENPKFVKENNNG